MLVHVRMQTYRRMRTDVRTRTRRRTSRSTISTPTGRPSTVASSGAGATAVLISHWSPIRARGRCRGSTARCRSRGTGAGHLEERRGRRRRAARRPARPGTAPRRAGRSRRCVYFRAAARAAERPSVPCARHSEDASLSFCLSFFPKSFFLISDVFLSL